MIVVLLLVSTAGLVISAYWIGVYVERVREEIREIRKISAGEGPAIQQQQQNERQENGKQDE